MLAKADVGTCHPHTYRVRFATCKVAPSSIFSAPSFVLSAAAFEGLALWLRSRLRERLSPSCRLQRLAFRASQGPDETHIVPLWPALQLNASVSATWIWKRANRHATAAVRHTRGSQGGMWCRADILGCALAPASALALAAAGTTAGRARHRHEPTRSYPRAEVQTARDSTTNACGCGAVCGDGTTNDDSMAYHQLLVPHMAPASARGDPKSSCVIACNIWPRSPGRRDTARAHPGPLAACPKPARCVEPTGRRPDKFNRCPPSAPESQLLPTRAAAAHLNHSSPLSPVQLIHPTPTPSRSIPLHVNGPSTCHIRASVVYLARVAVAKTGKHGGQPQNLAACAGGFLPVWPVSGSRSHFRRHDGRPQV